VLIGQILKDRFGIREDDVENALRIQKELGGYIGQILIQTGVINDAQLVEALSIQLDLPLFTQEESSIDVEAIHSLLHDKADLKYLVKESFIPIAMDAEKNILFVATSDPLNSCALDYLTKATRCRIQFSLATENRVKELAKLFLLDEARFVSLAGSDDPERLKEMAFEAPVIRFLNHLLNNAVELRSSDIHLESTNKGYRVRFRIDGILHDMEPLEAVFGLAVISRIKLLSGLDIAEKRLPQDGKFTTRIASKLLDIRVSTIPMVRGEGAMLRLLYRERLSFDIASLGLETDHVKMVLELIAKPNGIVLVTGPTGAGKTSTLYSCLTCLNKDERKIITIEDPVEYQLEGINQIHVRSDIGLTFAHALRSILRHDPDVIMVGEIRDRETAEIAIQSALTGHLVLSTLHTNDAAGGLFRLIDMGIEGYLINAAVIGIAAQRIIRRNCPSCTREDHLSQEVLTVYEMGRVYDRFKDLLNGGRQFKKGQGCPKCAGTGYRDRMAIFEIFNYTDELKEAFIRGKSLEQLRHQLQQQASYRTLREDGFIKVLKGATTMEEVLRVS
jgi:type II secretory ATPase GspE/PulE/Tfp pilus assembly ATPase PilB-like protein